MVKDKTKETFQEALSHVIDFYNANGHRVDIMRMDADSTENADDVTVFMEDHHITPEPAAVAEQNQNPVEREVQADSQEGSQRTTDRSDLTWSKMVVLRRRVLDCHSQQHCLL